MNDFIQAQPSDKLHKSFLEAVLLSYFLGIVGADRFYLGYFWLGLFKLLTVGGFGIMILFDIVRILTGDLRDHDGRELIGRDRYLKPVIMWLFVSPILLITSALVTVLVAGYFSS
jgi:hypothetical protein